MDFQCGDVTQRLIRGHTCVYYTAVQTKTRPLTGPSAELVFGENHTRLVRCVALGCEDRFFCGFHTVHEVLKYWIKEYEVEKIIMAVNIYIMQVSGLLSVAAVTHNLPDYEVTPLYFGHGGFEL